LLPKGLGSLGTEQFLRKVLNLVRRLRATIEMEHVAFRLEPVSQVDAAQHQRLAASVDEVGAGCMHKTMLGEYSWTEHKD
jgi:hypothetical protein